MNQILGTLFLLPAERLLNELLARDAHVAKSMLPFSGKVLEIQSTAPTAVLRIRFHENQIRIGSLDSTTLQQASDAVVSGSASNLFDLLLNPASKPLANRNIAVSGDALFVQDLFTTLRALDIDWRDYLAPLLGDIVTQEVSQFGERARQWGAQAQTNLRRSVDDYLKEEIRVVPDAAEVAKFSDDLDRLKLAIDRASARTRLLQDRLDKSLKNQNLSR